MSAEHLVIFAPSGKRGRFADGTDILSAARSLGVDIDSVCGGRGICGRCQVSIPEGEHASLNVTSCRDSVTPPGEVEARRAAIRGPLQNGRRLSCQARVLGDVIVDVPEDSQVHRQVVRKAASERLVTIDPVISLHAVEVASANMENPSSDGARLLFALAEQQGLGGLTIGVAVLAQLQTVMREQHHLVTAAIRHGCEVVAVFAGVRTEVAGLAIDIGSTTIAAHLCDLSSGEVLASAGVMNPQIRFGEDLMSRVSYAMLNADGAGEMTAAVRIAIDALAGTVTEQAGIDKDAIVETVIVGNPVMHHLFVGFDPTPLGAAPFALAWDGPLDIPARELGLKIAPGALVHILPCIGGHVGADAAAVVLAEAPHLSTGAVLIADVGTNAEIILGDCTRLLACSSPTGPAFEGAQLSAGQRAAPGAIERLRIDRQTLEPRYKVIGCDLWSDETGFAEGIRSFGVTGICGSGIIEALAEMYLAGLISTDGVIDGTLSQRTGRVQPDGRTFSYVISDGQPGILITQQDVRAIQLAKAALHAGCKLLMRRLGIETIGSIKLAGAFGAHIDPLHALVIGLVPDCRVGNVEGVGNAAGHGARIALLNKTARRDIVEVVRQIEKIETAIDPCFQAEFIAAMAFPHAQDLYEALAIDVTLPGRRPAQQRSRRVR